MLERDGKKTTHKRNSDHKKNDNDKLAARHRFSCMVQSHYGMRGHLSVL